MIYAVIRNSFVTCHVCKYLFNVDLPLPRILTHLQEPEHLQSEKNSTMLMKYSREFSFIFMVNFVLFLNVCFQCDHSCGTPTYGFYEIF